MKKMSEAQLFDMIALAASEQFAKLLVWSNNMALQRANRRGAEDMLAEALTDSLAVLVAISSVDPVVMAERLSIRLKSADFAAIRTRHFGFKIGVVDDPQVIHQAEKDGKLVHIGPSKEKA